MVFRVPAGRGPAPAARGPVPAARGPVPASRSGAAPQGAISRGWMKTGQVARATTDQAIQEQEIRREQRQRQRALPYEFWMRTGEQRDIVILDAEPGPCFWEHNLQNPATGHYDIYELCPKEFDHCPLCEGVAGAKDSVYTMFLTVLDITPGQRDKEGRELPYRRKLLRVKQREHGFFYRTFDRHGTLRGVHLLMSRDNDTDPRHGRPEFVALYTEEQIVGAYSHDAIISQRDGRVIVEANGWLQPTDYEAVFEKPSGEALRRRYGGRAPVGSRAEARQAPSTPLPRAGGYPTEHDETQMAEGGEQHPLESEGEGEGQGYDDGHQDGGHAPEQQPVPQTRAPAPAPQARTAAPAPQARAAAPAPASRAPAPQTRAANPGPARPRPQAGRAPADLDDDILF